MEDFEVQDTSSDSSMRIARGSMSADLKPRLAANISKGLCSIPTSDIEVSDLNLSKAKVYVNTPDRKFDTDIGVSNINAIIGLHNEGENRIGGMIRVWGSDETVDQEDGLDPEYNRATFVEKYSCTEDLATPISHGCELAPRVAEASGRLSVKMFANLVKYANAEESCGFESPIAFSNVKVHGAIGYRGGDVIIPIESDCILEFPEPTVIAEDCNGDQTIASGKVTLVEPRSSGIPTGDPVSSSGSHQQHAGDYQSERRSREFRIELQQQRPSFGCKVGATLWQPCHACFSILRLAHVPQAHQRGIRRRCSE